jgi:hypothetical protein
MLSAMMLSRILPMVAAAAVIATTALDLMGCGGADVGRPTPTGFVGTWKRADGTPSVISIRRDAEAYRFRWTLRDGPTSVKCDEPDRCFVYDSGTRVYEYRFRVFERPDASDHLFVECVGTPIEKGEPTRYLDRMSLQPGELELWSQTIERGDLQLAEPEAPLRFVKTADEPF